MKKRSAKKFVGMLFFLAVLAASLWYLFHDENLNQVLYWLDTIRLEDVIPAVIFVILFILGESVVIFYLLRQLGTKVPFFHCCLYSFIGFFYSAVTPSASGGQPMQLVAMRKDRISTAHSTVVLAIVTITYKLVLVLLGIGVLLFRPEPIMVYLDEVEPLMYLGLILNVGFIAFLLLAVFHPALAKYTARGIISLIGRIRPLKQLEKTTSRIDAFVENYSSAAAFFRDHPLIILNVFIITLLQRLCLFSVVWFTYLAFDLTGQSPVVMILLYAMISVAVDMLPLPGGMGISETLFATIYDPIFGEELVLPAMIVCRGISYYTQLLISAVMTGFAQLYLGRKKHKS